MNVSLLRLEPSVASQRRGRRRDSEQAAGLLWWCVPEPLARRIVTRKGRDPASRKATQGLGGRAAAQRRRTVEPDPPKPLRGGTRLMPL